MNQFQQTMQQGREGGFLRIASDVGLLLSAVLWTFAQLSLVTFTTPTDTMSWIVMALRGLVALVLALCCAVVLPALLAVITPSSPAGMLLQKYRRSTWGFVVLIAAAAFLGWYAYVVISSFWAASLNVPEFATTQSIVTLIFVVVVPAICFSWSSPMSWAAEVQQAHQVKRLELAHQADIMLAKTAYFRAISILETGLANATAAECQEVAGILAGMKRSENDALGAIVSSMRTVTGAELAVPTIEDGEIVKRYNLVAQRLEKRIMEVNDADYEEPRAIEDAAPQVTLDRRATGQRPATGDTLVALPAHQGAEWNGSSQGRVVSGRVPMGPTGTQGEASLDREALETARRAMSGAWTRARLEDVLDCSKSTASRLITQWRALALVEELTEPKHHYRWTGDAT